MPVTARLSKLFYDRLGEAVTNELVDWFNQVDATYRSDLREMNELNFARFDANVEQRFTMFDAKIERRFAGLELRFASFEQRFASLEQQFENLEERFENLEAKVEQRIALFETALNAKIDMVEWRLKARLEAAMRD